MLIYKKVLFLQIKNSTFYNFANKKPYVILGSFHFIEEKYL